MFKPVFAIALTLSVSACGGGGSTTPASVTPSLAAQNPASLNGGVLPASSGTIAAGYVQCDTAANIAAGNNCNGYANFSGGVFAFTAIAATSSGAPIAEQTATGGALAFANGALRVVESPSDSPPIVSISGGPWSTPGSVLSGAAGSYGNRFFIQCLQRGTATLQLELVSGANTAALPFASSSFPANTTTVNCTATEPISII